MIKKTSSNQPCRRDSEYITGAFLKSSSIKEEVDKHYAHGSFEKKMILKKGQQTTKIMKKYLDALRVNASREILHNISDSSNSKKNKLVHHSLK